MLIGVILPFLTGCNNKLTDLNGVEKSAFEVNDYDVYKDINYKLIIDSKKDIEMHVNIN